jgi:Zn-finger nucleic acid-binding protein
MRKLKFTDDLVLDSCERCRGIWFDHGETHRLRGLQFKALKGKVVLGDAAFKMFCHSCHELMDRNADRCPVCNWQNRIQCPVCGKPMKLVKYMNFSLDCCHECRGVWFDNIELSEIWNSQFPSAATAESLAPASWTDDSSYLWRAADVLDAIGLDGFVATGKAAGHGASEVVTTAPELAGAVGEGTVEAAGEIFEVIGCIIAGIFDS